MSIEIELRYEVTNQSALQPFIDTLMFLNKKQVIDVYFDTKDALLSKRGIYIRLRNNKTVDIKFNRACLHDANLEIQSYCEEYSFTLPLTAESLPKFNQINAELDLFTVASPDFALYLELNKFIEHRIVDKIRSSYKADQFIVVLDIVKNLGPFLEIELVTKDRDSISSTTAYMQEILKGLPVKPLKTGYDSLILRKQNFQQYLQSRFVLKEDKALKNNLSLLP